MSFIRSLIAGGHCPLYLDFRTGSLKDLSGTGNHAVSAGNEYWTKARGAGAIHFPSGSDLIVPYSISMDAVRTSGSFIVCCDFERYNTPANARIVKQGTALDIYMPTGGTAMSMSASTTPVWSTPIVGSRSLGASWVEGTYPRGFKNASTLGNGSVTLTVGAASISDLRIGTYNLGVNYYFGNPMFNFVLINEALSDVDMVRLMRELEAGPTVVRRPRNHFSIPYPAKTPAEYAAEGIILDLAPQVVNGKIPDLSGNGNDILEMDGKDVERGGPFTSLIRNASSTGGRTVAAVAYGGATKLTVSAWMYGSAGVGVPLESSVNVNSQVGSWYLIPESGSFRFAVNKTTISLIASSAGSALVPKLMHVVGVFDASASGTDRQRMFIDGVENSATPSGTIGTGAFADFKLHVFARNRSLLPYTGKLGPVVVRTDALTPAEIRAEYLKGARKCILDARVHSDGSCPVSLAAVGAPNEIANGWKVESGTWKVVEDAPVNGRAGQRWIQWVATNDTRVSIPDTSAYGSWHTKMVVNDPGDRFECVFISQTFGAPSAGSYAVTYVGGSIWILKDGGTTIATGPTGLSPTTAPIEFWIERTGTGLITVWALGGGIWSDWTQIMQGTNTVYTSNVAQTFTTRDTVKFAGSVHYLG